MSIYNEIQEVAKELKSISRELTITVQNLKSSDERDLLDDLESRIYDLEGQLTAVLKKIY